MLGAVFFCFGVPVLVFDSVALAFEAEATVDCFVLSRRARPFGLGVRRAGEVDGRGGIFWRERASTCFVSSQKYKYDERYGTTSRHGGRRQERGIQRPLTQRIDNSI